MGQNNYLGGHTVWNGRHLARDNWGDGPVWQSRRAAELLGSSDPLIVKFGERFCELEMHIRFTIDSIKTCNDPNFSDFVCKNYFKTRSYVNSYEIELFRTNFKKDNEKIIEFYYEKLGYLQNIMIDYIEYSNDVVKHRNSIKTLLKNKREF